MATASIRARAFQPLPKWLQRLRTTAFAEKHDRAAFQIQHHRHRLLTCPNGEFSEGDLRPMSEFRRCVMFLQMPLLNLLDHVPTDLELPGHVWNRHRPRQFQRVPLEAPRVTHSIRGELDFHWADDPATPAQDPRNRQHDPDRLRADPHRANERRVCPLAITSRERQHGRRNRSRG